MNINAPLQGKAIAFPFTKAANAAKRAQIHNDDEALHLPFARRLPDGIRNHFVAMCGEYVGTVLFLFFALGGTQVANNIPTSSGQSVAEVGSNPQQLQYIALCFGFSLAVNAWVFFRISGGLFNPAVTFGMCLIGAVPWLRGALLFFVQILGGITAAALVSCMFPGPLSVQTSLGGGTTVVQGLFIEMMLTAELVFCIFMLAAEKHKGTFIAPVGIGLSLFIAELVGVYFTGGSLNPARTFGPCVVKHSFHHYHWIYWLGPILGSIVAAGFYKFIKILEYETGNPNAALSPSREAEVEAEKHLASQPSRDSNHTYGDFADGVTDQDSDRNLTGAAAPVRHGKTASDSAAMGTHDEVFSGLADGGMHGGQQQRPSDMTNSPGMVVSDGTPRRPTGRGASYMA